MNHAEQTVLIQKAQYWLDLAAKNTHRGEHYQALCQYKMAAGYFFELSDKERLRQIFKKRPDVKSLLSEEITEFAESDKRTEKPQCSNPSCQLFRLA